MKQLALKYSGLLKTLKRIVPDKHLIYTANPNFFIREGGVPMRDIVAMLCEQTS